MNEQEPNKIYQEIQSDTFDLWSCIDYLRKNPNNIGIQFYLVKKLQDYNYEEIKFFIPQFLQLLMIFETKSIALEDFLLSYCLTYPHFSMIMFWNLQVYVHMFRNDARMYLFKVVNNFINRLLTILFDLKLEDDNESFGVNNQLAWIFCGTFASTLVIKEIKDYCIPLIRTQMKQTNQNYMRLRDDITNQKNMPMCNENIDLGLVKVLTVEDLIQKTKTKNNEEDLVPTSKIREYDDFDNVSESNIITSKKKENSDLFCIEKNINKTGKFGLHKHFISTTGCYENEKNIASSLNNKGCKTADSKCSDIVEQFYKTHFPKMFKNNLSSHKNLFSSLNKEIIYQHLVKILHINYAKKESDFMIALQNISLKLSQLPKKARLSALRAELSIINETLLPSEIDIPQLLPSSNDKNNKLHRILRINVNEAFILNSSERVPFLMLIEYLKDDIDFNPTSKMNQKIILDKEKNFDLSFFKKFSLEFDNLIQTNNIDLNNKDKNNDIFNMSLNLEVDLTDFLSLSFNEQDVDFNNLDINNVEYNKDNVNSYLSFKNNPNNNSKKNPADQMRIASIMLQQLDNSSQINSEQFITIKNKIIESMVSLQDQFDSINYSRFKNKQEIKNAGERKLENDFKISEDWNTKKNRIKNLSAYGHLHNWDLCSVVAKNGRDLLQEAFACQLITLISNTWTKYNLTSWIKEIKMLMISANFGLVETINNAMSIHSIKKSLTEMSVGKDEISKGQVFTLLNYFINLYKSSNSDRYKMAQKNFAISLASYSIVCYVLQIKDRHNGNIMLDTDGHIIHIDFGFFLSNTPGSVGFEASPFKLTSEYVDFLGGLESSYYLLFKDICKKCFNALRKENNRIIGIVELMQKKSSLPCFSNGENTSVFLKQRLQLHLTDEESDTFVENNLIGKSLGSIYTKLYDQFQMVTQGIYS